MFNKMKYYSFALLAFMAMVVGVTSIKPMSFFTWHQPEAPKHLLNG